MANHKKKKLSKEDEQDVNLFLEKRNQDQSLNYTVSIKCKTENQKAFINLIKEKEIIITGGNAGTGKTFLSCAEALKLLKSDPRFRKILLVKSVTTLKKEDVGFLKGDLMEKIMPFMNSFFDNFNKLIGEEKTMKLIESKKIEFQPLAYIRGRSIDNTIIIVDEAQNIDHDNMKTVMTRLGENSKLIIIGDTKQIDLGNKKQSSLEFVIKKFTNRHPSIGVCSFGPEDIVRNPLIKIIEDTFEEND